MNNLRYYNWEIKAMSSYEKKVLKEIGREQVTHPMEEYRPGHPHLEKLYAEIERQQRFTWPSLLTLNV